MAIPGTKRILAVFGFVIVLVFAIDFQYLDSPQSHHTSKKTPDTIVGIEIGGNYFRAGVFRNHSFELITDAHGHSKFPARLPSQDVTERGSVESNNIARANSDERYDLSHLVQNVTRAVISFPTYFSDSQREDMRQAATSAGIDVLRTINDSVAALTAYAVDSMRTRRGEEGNHFLLYNANPLTSTVEIYLAHDRGLLTTIGYEQLGGYVDDQERRHRSTHRHVTSVLKHAHIGYEKIRAIVVIGDLDITLSMKPFLESLFPGRAVLQSPDFSFEEAVIYGAAMIAHRSSDEYDGVFPLVMDALPFHLGVESPPCTFLTVMHKDTMIPDRAVRTITAEVEDHGPISIRVYRGHNEINDGSSVLGTLELDMSAAVRGRVNVDISFEVDANFALTAEVTERASKRNAKIVVFLDID